MRRDIWQLHPVDIIVPSNHMIETMLPVHCHKWHSIIIVKQESTISIYGLLHFRCISILDDCLKHLCHILCDWQYSCSGICLCSFYDVSHIRCSLQLVINIYSSVLKINVPLASSHKILIFAFPYEIICTPLHNIYSTPHRHAQTSETFASDLL